MRTLLLPLFLICSLFSSSQIPDNRSLDSVFKKYSEEGIILSPLGAVYNGDYRFNDQLPVTFTDSYIEKLKEYFNRYLALLNKFNRHSLSANDKISYDIFKRNLDIGLEGLSYNENRTPFNQMSGLHLQLGQLGSGTGAQPFKTLKDHEDWIVRAKKFGTWADSAILYFRKGIAEKNVLPKALVVKIIPQLRALQQQDAEKSVFYGPVNLFPSSFSEADKLRLKEAYKQLIAGHINPAYNRLEKFMSDEYLPHSRSTSGIGSLKNGDKRYAYWVRNYTTLDKSSNEVYNTGLAEVKRIRKEMEKIKRQTGFKGTLDSFFHFTKTAPQFLPYKTAEEVLNDYRAIEKKIEPHLNKLFTHRPKTKFEVRQTEAFRAATAAAEYQRGLPDGSRPGIFYVPIVDPLSHNPARESLFLHEAIPGHHFQVMIQKENTNLPWFRQDGGTAAYSEGWALYCESLGKLLGCYTDPYQHFAALGDEIHRAIRLVVDAGMHAKGWSREQAIKYMMDNEPISLQKATAEIERYMAWPGQALSYKTGELKIKELRDKYSKKLGRRFSLAAFHDELIKDGAMPLVTLEAKMDAWAGKVNSE